MSAAKNYLSESVAVFLRDLASKSPTPGGGSVASLVAALGAALGRMAVAFSVGKPKFAAHEERLQQVDVEFQRAGDLFTQLIREDMAAYERYASARKSGDAEELQRAIATTIAVPMEIVAVAAAIAGRLDEIKGCVSKYLVSDLQVGAILADAAARSAALMVRVNLRDLADRKEAERLDAQLDQLLGRSARHANAVAHYQSD